jgi:hypothetical protein
MPYLNLVGFIVWTKKYEFDCLICCLLAVGTIDNDVVSLLSAGFANLGLSTAGQERLWEISK